MKTKLRWGTHLYPHPCVALHNLHYEKFPDGTLKCIEDEIPFELPEGWEWCRFNRVVDVRDGTHDTPSYVPNGIPLITSKNLSEGGIDCSNVKYISYEDALSINERSGVDKGDILFAMIGTIGNPAMVSDDTLISIKNVALFKFTYSLNINHKYIMAYLEYAQDDMKKRPSGGLQPFVSLNFLRQYFVPIPPILEQHRIVEKLNELLSFIDTIETDKTSLQDLMEQTKAKILDLAIKGKLVRQNPNDEPASALLERIRAEKEELIKQGKIKRDKKESVIFKGEDNSYYETIGSKTMCIDGEIPYDLPDGWEWCRLQSISTFELGKTLDNAKNKGNFRHYLRSVNVRWNGIDLTDVNQMRFEKDELERYRLKKKDLLICEGGDVGRSCIWNLDEEMYYQNALHRVRFYQNIIPEIYLFIMMHYSFIGKFDEICKGVTIKHLTATTLKSLIFPLPPLNEQKRIADKVSQLFSLLDSIAENIN